MTNWIEMVLEELEAQVNQGERDRPRENVAHAPAQAEAAQRAHRAANARPENETTAMPVRTTHGYKLGGAIGIKGSIGNLQTRVGLNVIQSDGVNAAKFKSFIDINYVGNKSRSIEAFGRVKMLNRHGTWSYEAAYGSNTACSQLGFSNGKYFATTATRPGERGFVMPLAKSLYTQDIDVGLQKIESFTLRDIVVNGSAFKVRDVVDAINTPDNTSSHKSNTVAVRVSTSSASGRKTLQQGIRPTTQTLSTPVKHPTSVSMIMVFTGLGLAVTAMVQRVRKLRTSRLKDDNIRSIK